MPALVQESFIEYTCEGKREEKKNNINRQRVNGNISL